MFNFLNMILCRVSFIVLCFASLFFDTAFSLVLRGNSFETINSRVLKKFGMEKTVSRDAIDELHGKVHMYGRSLSDTTSSGSAFTEIQLKQLKELLSAGYTNEVEKQSSPLGPQTSHHIHNPAHNHHNHHEHESNNYGFMLDFPPYVKTIWINIGSNIDPPMPPEDDQSVFVIAVEPILGTAHKIPYHDRLFVITCAIADVPRFQMMNVMNVGGLSSSLNGLKGRPWWKNYVDIDPRVSWKSEEYKKANAKPEHQIQITPVMPLKMLLHAIPSTINITHLHTDMQGFDFVAIKSAGKALSRVNNVQVECYLNDITEYDLKNISNSCYQDFVPFMTSIGYRLDHTHKMGNEADAFFILR